MNTNSGQWGPSPGGALSGGWELRGPVGHKLAANILLLEFGSLSGWHSLFLCVMSEILCNDFV